MGCAKQLEEKHQGCERSCQLKPPRWFVVSLLSASAFATLGAGAGWWVTWPERTARRFAELLADNQVEEASKMVDERLDKGWATWKPLAQKYTSPWNGAGTVDFRCRTLADVVQSRLECQVRGTCFVGGFCGFGGSRFEPREPLEIGFRFVVARGRVTATAMFIFNGEEQRTEFLLDRRPPERLDDSWRSVQIGSLSVSSESAELPPTEWDVEWLGDSCPSGESH
jgi:hypothetical protein